MIAQSVVRWGFVSLLVVLAGCEYAPAPAVGQPIGEGGARAPVQAADAAVLLAVTTAEGFESSPASESGPLAVGVEDLADGEVGATEDAASPGDPDARFPRPRSVRGLYVNAWAAGSRTRMDVLFDVARSTEVNSFVIDIKDATGFLSHRSEVALAHEIGATEEIRIGDLPGLLARFESEGVYPIARIVVVKDPILVKFRPEFAVSDTAGGVWVDSKGLVWLNPYSTDVWEYHVEIAREVARLGFPEIQFDYVRFPDAPQSDLARAVFEGSEGRPKTAAIREFLLYAREGLADLNVETTVDVFGVTTSARRDVGIGQVWESMIDAVDVALPMVYPSHYWEGSFGFGEPNAHPYEIVRRALTDAMSRSAGVDGAGRTRPWLQDFSLGKPIYAAAEVRAQIQATYDAGVDEWVLWNPGSRYTGSALEPVDGFEREPLIRVAGVLAPVSRRHVVLDSVAALPEPVEPDESASPPDAVRMEDLPSPVADSAPDL